MLHLLQGYPLSKAWGSWYGPTLGFLTTVFHVVIAVAEHFTLRFPLVDDLVYGLNLFNVGALEFFLFMYLAYNNPTGVEKKKKATAAVVVQKTNTSTRIGKIEFLRRSWI